MFCALTIIKLHAVAVRAILTLYRTDTLQSDVQRQAVDEMCVNSMNSNSSGRSERVRVQLLSSIVLPPWSFRCP